MLIVQVCHFDDNGDAHYRLHEPSRHLAQLPGVTAIDCHFAHRYLEPLTELADVLVLQFVNDWDLVSHFAPRRARGQITVFEANDDFFDLQPWSPIAARWQDRTVQELYSQLLVLADGVQTSTEALSGRWRARGARHVAVFANHLREIPPLPPVPKRPLTIGWAGSPGHFADWYQLVPLLTKWLGTHPDVHLAVMTNELAHSFFQLPPERYHCTRFGSLQDYLRFLRGVDIGLAPLLPTEYNRGRSDVKFLEYASQGVAGIYADLEPYRNSVVHGETGLLYRSQAELLQCLDRLYADAIQRQKIRRQAYEYVRDHRLLSNHIGERAEWYRGLLRGQVRSSPLPAEIEQAAQREGNYLQLLPQEPETTLMSALKQPSRDAALHLEKLVAHYPRYLAARQNWGRLLNDLNDPRAPEELRILRDMGADRGQPRSEYARMLFKRNEFEPARQALEAAINGDPHYLPAWQYLLRMLSLSRHPDGPRWAAAAIDRFPTCYPLALLGAATLPREQAAEMLLRLLDRFAPTFTADEKQTAMTAFRDAIMTAIQAAPSSLGNVPLLHRACAVFPESARLAELLGELLLAAGESEEGYRHQVRALNLRRQADVIRREFPEDDAPPYLAMFAEHILRYQNAGVERLGGTLPSSKSAIRGDQGRNSAQSMSVPAASAPSPPAPLPRSTGGEGRSPQRCRCSAGTSAGRWRVADPAAAR